jgi:hypothetical protein
MERLAIVVGLAVVAVAVALWLQRRRPTAEPTTAARGVPQHLARADFERPNAPWLVVAFTSETCDVCASVWQRAHVLESDEVAVQNVEAKADRELHQRYRIDAVPMVVVADEQGDVRWNCVGPLTASDLWGALAEVRRPGTVPPDCSASPD